MGERAVRNIKAVGAKLRDILKVLSRPEQCDYIVDKFNEDYRFKLNIKFINFIDMPIWDIQIKFFEDPIIIMYNTGAFEIIPKGLAGGTVKDYLGYRCASASAWGLLPGLRCPAHPYYADPKNNCVSTMPLYERINETTGRSPKI